MDVSTVGSGAFEFYDGLRILIPGTFVVALYVAIGDTFGFLSGIGDVQALPAIVGGLIAGILLMFLDIPSFAAVYHYESPLLVLESWDRYPPRGSYLLNVYYELLDGEFPGTMRTRTHYLGVIYRIGFEAVFLLTLPAIAVLTLGTIYPSVGSRTPHINVKDGHLALIIGAVLLFAIFMAAIVTRWRGRNRSSKYETNTFRRQLEGVVGEIVDELQWLDVSCMAVGLTCALVFAWTDMRPFGVVGVALTMILWALRYQFGIRRPEVVNRADKNVKARDKTTGTILPNRMNPHVQTGMVYSTVAAAAMLICAYHGLSANGPLGTTALVDWLGALTAGSLLLVSRSHERKLLGSYAEQRTWLNRNQDKMIANGYFGASKNK